MKKILFLLFITSFAFFSCTPEIKIKANKDNSVEISFKTGFLESTTKTLKLMSGTPESSSLFSPNELNKFLIDAGATNIVSEIPNENEIFLSGNVKSIKNSALYATGLLNKTDSNICLTIGPTQIQKFYNLLDSNTQSYFDLMMIPCLIGEEYDVNDYGFLLSSMYGPSFSNEILNGLVIITLESPNGKKTQVVEKLGDILTMKKDKNWNLSW